MSILKEFGRALWEGRSLFSVSFPAKMFDTTSFANRFIDQFGFVSTYFNIAAHKVDFEERFKYVVSCFTGGLYLSLKLRKPFNPILGETFQGTIGDDCTIFIE